MAKGRGAHAKEKSGGKSEYRGPAETRLHQSGMRNCSPMDGDRSMRCNGPSVNAKATREGVAPTPRSLGSRVA